MNQELKKDYIILLSGNLSFNDNYNDKYCKLKYFKDYLLRLTLVFYIV